MTTDVAKDDRAEKQLAKKGFVYRKWKLLLLGFVLFLAALAFCAPVIVAKTPLRNRVVKMLVPDFQGEVTIGSASLSWLTPVELHDVTVRDTDGNVLLKAQSVSSKNSLLGLIANLTDLGEFHINAPHVFLEVRQDGSNLEDAIAPLLEASSGDGPVSASIVVAGGLVDVVEKETGKRWNLEQLKANVELPADGTQVITAEATTIVKRSAGETSNLAVVCSWRPGDVHGKGKCSVRCQELPLAIVCPVLRRFVGDVRGTGLVSAGGVYEWNGNGSWHKMQIRNLDGRQLSLFSPQWIGTDNLALGFLKSSGDFEIRDGRLQANELKLESDLGGITADGSVAFDRITVNTWMSALTDEDYRVAGELDLAKLANMLPQTIRLRQTAHIHSGKVSLTVAGKAEGDRRRCVATVDVSNLAGEVDGKPVRWQRPINVTLTAGNSDAGPTIESLTCKSSFLHVQGKGDIRRGEVEVSGDLDQLAQELGQFVDLAGYHLRGNFQAHANWKADEQGSLKANGSAQLQNLDVQIPGSRPWREQELLAKVDADGRFDSEGLKRIDRATVRIDAGTDRLTATLSDGAKWPVELPLTFDCQLVGQLSTWLPRLKSILPIEEFSGDGAVMLNTRLALHDGGVDVPAADLSLKAVNFLAGVFQIREPEVQINLAGSLDLINGICTLEPTTVACSSMAFRAENVALEDGEHGLQVKGDVAYRADLGRLSTWWENPQSPPSEKLFGRAIGSARLTHDNGKLSLTTSTQFEDLILATRIDKPANTITTAASGQSAWQTVWQEKQLAVDGELTFEHSTDRLQLNDVKLASETLQVVASGSVDRPTTLWVADLHGDVLYDWEKLSPILRPLLGQIRITGNGQRSFSVKGPLLVARVPGGESAQSLLVPPQLVASAGLSWNAVEAYGIHAGPGQLDARLESGIVRLAPVDIAVSEGRLHAAPRIELNAPSPALLLEKGPLLQQVRISPAMCQSWLKFVAPWLADATRAEGTFSASLENANLPLADPFSGNVEGVLEIHAAQIGPGPQGRQLQQLARQVRQLAQGRPLDLASPSSNEWLVVPAQQVPVQLRNGRVHHQGLEFLAAKDVVVRTSGSVGTDETLDLIAEVPVRDEWVVNQRLLSALQGKTVTFPIRGSLSNPKIDRKVLKDLSGQLLRGSAERILEDQLKRGLDNLFRLEN